MPASIKDIARRLNISTSTVSYALNGGPRTVRPEIREQVLALARELKYRPNRLARAMITGRSHTIGIIPPEVGDNVFLSPYLHLALNGITNEAGRLGLDLLLYTRATSPDRDEMLDRILDGRVDGVIFVSPGFLHKTVEVATSLHLPCVIISGAPIENVVSFSVDNDRGVRQALDHLYQLGHRKIAHLAGRLDMQDAVVRMQAYQQFLHDHGLPYRDEWVVKGRFLLEGGSQGLRELINLPERPTAIFCANDEMALGAIYAAQELGISVPKELSIVGFDCTTPGEKVLPPLTTVEQPIGQMAAAAVRTLIDMVEGREPERHRVFETALVVRSSTSHPTEEYL